MIVVALVIYGCCLGGGANKKRRAHKYDDDDDEEHEEPDVSPVTKRTAMMLMNQQYKQGRQSTVHSQEVSRRVSSIPLMLLSKKEVALRDFFEARFVIADTSNTYIIV